MDLFDPQTLPLTKYLFFTGKGGVGKTTTAAATAVTLAEAGNRVIIVSTDPASNLQDVFDTELTNKPTAVPGVANLFAANFDPVIAAAEYREQVVGPYRGILPDAAITNMEEQLSGSCTVEIASFNEFANFLTDDQVNPDFQYVIFDTAPTGHALRMLELPAAWNDYLDENTRGASCLGQLAGLGDKHEMYAKAVTTLNDASQTTLMLVTRPQKESLKEAGRAALELAATGIHNQHLIINGVLEMPTDAISQQLWQQQQAVLQNLPEALTELPVAMVPLRAYNVIGLTALKQVLKAEQPVIPAKTIVNTDYPTLQPVIADLLATNKQIVFTMGKGGVGKTAVAVTIAAQLAAAGKTVHLATTDPAGNLSDYQLPATIAVSHIDEIRELKAYQDEVLAAAEGMASADIDYIKEDLRSPCTQEIAVFRAFANIVAQTDCDIVVIDTAPTGHTLLLLDSTQSYAKEVEKTAGTVPEAISSLLPKLQDPTITEIVMVTLPEATPVLESLRLNDDLNRAQMAHTWWVVNQSMLVATPTHPCLQARAQSEAEWIAKVQEVSTDHYAVIPWQANSEQSTLHQ